MLTEHSQHYLVPVVLLQDYYSSMHEDYFYFIRSKTLYVLQAKADMSSSKPRETCIRKKNLLGKFINKMYLDHLASCRENQQSKISDMSYEERTKKLGITSLLINPKEHSAC